MIPLYEAAYLLVVHEPHQGFGHRMDGDRWAHRVTVRPPTMDAFRRSWASRWWHGRGRRHRRRRGHSSLLDIYVLAD
jgi:hypothetical protein